VSCEKQTAYSRLLTEEYPALYKQVYERNADSLLDFTDHTDEFIRAQAWRSLINTQIEDLDTFITKVQYANTEEAWMALSHKELGEGQLKRLHTLWEERSILRKGISRVLGKQGNQESLNVLVQNFNEIVDAEHEFESALAISRLMMNFEAGEQTKRSILRYAAVTEDPSLYRAYFYGFYRGNIIVEDQQILDAIWDGYIWVENPEIRQYILRIAFNAASEETLQRLPVTDIATMDVQLAVELANQIQKVEWSNKLEDVVSRLLEHQNPVVNETVLSQINNHPAKNADFDSTIIRLIVENQEKEASVRLSGIYALEVSEPFLSLAKDLAERNKYLVKKNLRILLEVIEPSEYITIIESYAETGSRLEMVFAAETLSDLWGNLSTSQKNNSLKSELRELIFTYLDQGDRSITYSLVPFINDSGLLVADDYQRIEEYLSVYTLPDDLEVYQAFGALLKDKFEANAIKLIDSLAGYGNAALNNTLIDQGWDIQQPENISKSFRTPDWKRLGELGPNPFWILETEKGTINIEINALSAPATISGIDSLTETGAYDDVAFHRVVPNFVVQGGDVETGDGFGGPDYVVPTEASSKQYETGQVGIASAGIDTEGSQYFIMLDWAPHLNGRYTIIGEVHAGMDVIEQIMVGDKVKKVYWIKNTD
jgi:cyclophilin family peptidyl-prolyl cis-trans isomerase